MLNKDKIGSIVNEHFKGTDKFLVQVNVSSTNIVDVYVDGDNGINIKECAGLSRLIESKFDREVEDFELRVSSPGIDKPFRMLRQYTKYINKPIIVTTVVEEKLKGILLSCNEEFIELEVAGKKKEPSRMEKIFFENIKEAKPDIVF